MKKCHLVRFFCFTCLFFVFSCNIPLYETPLGPLPPEKGKELVKNTLLLAQILTELIAGLMLFFLWVHYVQQRGQKIIQAIRRYDDGKGLFFIALFFWALALAAINGVFKLTERDAFKIGISLLNSFFLLLSFPDFDIVKSGHKGPGSWITEHIRNPKAWFFKVFYAMVILLFASYFIEEEGWDKYLDFALSVAVLALLTLLLMRSFWYRGSPSLTVFSLVLFLLAAAVQWFAMDDENKNSIYYFSGLGIAISQSMIFMGLAFTWALQSKPSGVMPPQGSDEQVLLVDRLDINCSVPVEKNGKMTLEYFECKVTIGDKQHLLDFSASPVMRLVVWKLAEYTKEGKVMPQEEWAEQHENISTTGLPTWKKDINTLVNELLNAQRGEYELVANKSRKGYFLNVPANKIHIGLKDRE